MTNEQVYLNDLEAIRNHLAQTTEDTIQEVIFIQEVESDEKSE